MNSALQHTTVGKLIDTHCHIHEPDYPIPLDVVCDNARKAGVEAIVTLGEDIQSSRRAVDVAGVYSNIFAAVGVHPHNAQHGWQGIETLVSAPRVVAVGEIGLDYHYMLSPRSIQIACLEAHLQLALDSHLPVSLHVRNAYEDFWPILANFPGIRGVLHSFTDSRANLDRGLESGLYIGVNGISTFTKDREQLAVLDAIPLNRLCIETDAPYLTPTPLRGKVNEVAYVRIVAEYLATRRGVAIEDLARHTTHNARELFAIQ